MTDRRPATPRVAAGWPTRFLLGLLALLILTHLALATTEALLRPLFPWDATMHWATKARVWFDQASLVPFVHTQDWLEMDSSARVFTDHHPDYPPTVSLLQLWIVVALGAWSETLINLPWPLFMLSVALIFYGQARYLGVSTLSAVCFCYFLLSLPLLGTQVALAGYADFPMGVCYLAAALALLRWTDAGSRRQLLLGVFLTLMLTQIKNEGFFWALTLIAGLILGQLPRKLALLALLAGVFALLAVLMFLPGDLMIAGHSLDSLRLRYEQGSLGMLFLQFAYRTWHLLGLMMLCAAIGVVFLRGNPVALRTLATMLLLSLGLYLFLFTYTRFSHGAVHLTAAARIGLHLAPAAVFLAMLVWQRAGDALRYRV